MVFLAGATAFAARDDERVASLKEQIRTLGPIVDAAKNPAEKTRLDGRLRRLREELGILEQRQALEARERELQGQRATSPLDQLREKLRAIDATTDDAEARVRALVKQRQQTAAARDALATEAAAGGAGADGQAQAEERLFTKNEEVRAVALEIEAADAELDLARDADRLREELKTADATGARAGLRALFEAYARLRKEEGAGDQLGALLPGLDQNFKVSQSALDLAQQKLAKFDEEFAVLEKQTNFLNRAARIERLLAEERSQKNALAERMPFLARQVDAIRRSQLAVRARQELATLKLAFLQEQFQLMRTAYGQRLRWPAVTLAGLIALDFAASLVLLPLRYKNESLLLARRLVRYLLVLVAVGVVAAFSFDDLSMVATTLGVASAALVISLQDVCASVFGWFVIMSGGKFRIGDRVEIDGVRGDVIDLQLLRTTLLEINGWLGVDQPTGRVIVVSNNFIFKSKVFNFNHGHPFIWGKIDVTVTFATPVASALALFQRVLEEETREEFAAARAAAATMQKRYGVEDADYRPKIYTHIADSGVTLSLIYVAHYRSFSTTRNRINRRLVAELESHRHIQLAYHTLQLLHQNPAIGTPSAVLGPDVTTPPFMAPRPPGVAVS